MGIPTRSVLRSPVPAFGEVEEPIRQAYKQRYAAREMRILGAFTLRSVIAGFVGIAQILRLVESGVNAGNTYRERLRSGREPFLNGTCERIIRLGGIKSDVTELSMSKHGSHIVPIFENPRVPSASSMYTRHSQQETRPVFWHVESNRYGDPDQWSGFRPTPDWLLSSHPQSRTPQRHFLLVEADATVGDVSLSLTDKSASDLTVQEASQGYRMIEALAHANGVFAKEDVMLVKVLLADPQTKIPTGGGGSYTLGEHIAETSEVDILINSKKSLVNAIMAWLSNIGVIPRADSAYTYDGPKVVIFDTGNTEYFHRVQGLLKTVGIRVIERSDKFARQHWQTLPRLVYHDTTSDTVNAVRSLIVNAGIPNRKVCALIDRASGVDELAPFDGQGICSAVVYDKLFERVRHELRMGTGLKEIQRIVDEMSMSHLSKKTEEHLNKSS